MPLQNDCWPKGDPRPLTQWPCASALGVAPTWIRFAPLNPKSTVTIAFLGRLRHHRRDGRGGPLRYDQGVVDRQRPGARVEDGGLDERPEGGRVGHVAAGVGRRRAVRPGELVRRRQALRAERVGRDDDVAVGVVRRHLRGRADPDADGQGDGAAAADAGALAPAAGPLAAGAGAAWLPLAAGAGALAAAEAHEPKADCSTVVVLFPETARMIPRVRPSAIGMARGTAIRAARLFRRRPADLCPLSIQSTSMWGSPLWCSRCITVDLRVRQDRRILKIRSM